MATLPSTAKLLPIRNVLSPWLVIFSHSCLGRWNRHNKTNFPIDAQQRGSIIEIGRAERVRLSKDLTHTIRVLDVAEEGDESSRRSIPCCDG